MASNKRVTVSPKVRKPKPKGESIIVEKPERFSQEEWDALDPIQKARYAGNSGLWKKGESSKKRIPKEPQPWVKERLETITRGTVVVTGGLPPAEGSGESLPVQVPLAFEVVESKDPKEVVQVNGTALLVDAFKRAARAPQNVDAFDKHVYLALLQKMPGLSLSDDKRPETPAEAKRNVRLLQDLLAEEGSFRDVKEG